MDEISKELPGLVRVYKDGRIHKLMNTELTEPGVDSSTGVQSKDILISPETPLSVRIYIPPNSNEKKLPLLVFFHGGAFIVGSVASIIYHSFLNLISFESNVVIVSVDYRTAPEHPIPACYDDAWEGITWVMLHVDGNGPELWLNEYADFENVFFAGDSAGGNISHHMAIRVGSGDTGVDMNINLKGVILLHPYFWGKDRIGSEREHPRMKGMGDVWMFAYPGTSGLDDPLINPDMDPNVSDLGCSRILVCVGELDILKDRGFLYKGILGKIGWVGEIEVVEDKGVGHVFFLYYPSDETTCTLRKRISTFINCINK